MRRRAFAMPVRLILPVVAIGLLAMGTTIIQAPSAAAETPASAQGPQQPPELAAFKQARETGEPVEVPGQQTPNTTILADPDGQFTYRSTARPERVQQNGQWRGIDTTLVKRGDGFYAPVASTANVVFSGGGTAPLVTLSTGDKRLTLSWPAPLPTPRVAGSSATYPSVLPGVDLQVTATADSYRKTLIVHDAAAAKNPALTAITLEAASTGLNLSAGPDGALNATDVNGKLVFVGSTPLMWDSRHEAGQPIPTADEPGNTTHVNLDVNTTNDGKTRVTITPDPAALTGNDVVYPVYIDPTTGDVGPSDWGDIANNNYKNYRDTYARVGRCYLFPGCNGNWVARSFFVMPTHALLARNGVSAVIHSGTFTITNAHTGDNGCNPVQALRSDVQFTSSTAWPGPGALYNMDSPKSACSNNASVQFDAVDAARSVVASNSSQVTIGLRSTDETIVDQHRWNRFANNPVLAVRFAFPPNAATNAGVFRAVSCSGTATTPDRHPTLYATATDNNTPALNLLLYFEVWTSDGKTRVAASPGVQIASGTTAAWRVDVDLGNGDWAYRVAVQNTGGDGSGGLWSGSHSPWSWFITRGFPPADAEVSSRDYPENYWGPSAGTFTFRTSGPNVVGYAYSFDGPGTVRIPNTDDCNYNQTFPNGGWVATDVSGSAVDVPIIPAGFAPGYHTLHVRAFDTAHNLSAREAAYTFYVAPNYGVATRINPGDPGQVTVSQPPGQNITITQRDNSVHFKATAARQSFSMEFTAPIEADYSLALRVGGTVMNWNNIDVSVNGVAKPQIPARQRFGALGGVHLSKGRHVITLTTTDTPGGPLDPYPTTIVGIDAIPLKNVTTNSFADAMNNDGISNDGTTFTADKSLDMTGAALSARTMAAAGLSPGSTLTVQGATFALPSPNSSTGNDNVVAIGQTIPLPAAQQVPSSAIGLLAISTCGATPATTASITYTDGTTDEQALAAVPDWTSAPQGVATPVTTLSYRNIGATRDTVNRPTLYAVFIPANPLKTPHKITLPNLGTAFRQTCLDLAALHVLALAPRPVTPPDGKTWVGAWTAPADTTSAPPSGGFADKTLRVIAHPAITGSQARIRLSNTGSPTPVTIDAATIAAQTSGAATTSVPTTLRFSGSTTVTIPSGGDAYSDPVALPTGGSGNVAVSLHLPNAVATAPVHTANGTVTYVASGNATSSQDGTPYQTNLPSTFYVTAIDVTTAAGNGTVAILADQNTSAPGIDPAAHPSWGDTLATQLGTDLPGGLITTTHTNTPPPGWWTARNQTTLAGPRLRTVVITLGAQDILNGNDPQTIENKLTGLIRDINGYNRYKRPDGARIHVILATIAPLGLDPNSTQEKNRQQLNASIINGYEHYGANELLHLDEAVRDSAQPSNTHPAYLTGGSPNDAYYQRIAQTFKTGVDTGTLTP